MIETVANAHQLDGLVCLTNCDKITPGILMAIARLNIPSIVVTAGPMLSGYYGGKRLSLVRDTFEAIGQYKAGKIDKRHLEQLELRACPGPGACQGLYTANTMACLTESLGLSLPNCGTSPAVLNKKLRIAYESGQKIVELAKKNITSLKYADRDARAFYDFLLSQYGSRIKKENVRCLINIIQLYPQTRYQITHVK